MSIVVRTKNPEEHYDAMRIQLKNRYDLADEVIKFCNGKIETRHFHNECEPTAIALCIDVVPVLVRVGEFLLKTKNGDILPCSVSEYYQEYTPLEEFTNKQLESKIMFDPKEILKFKEFSLRCDIPNDLSEIIFEFSKPFKDGASNIVCFKTNGIDEPMFYEIYYYYQYVLPYPKTIEEFKSDFERCTNIKLTEV